MKKRIVFITSLPVSRLFSAKLAASKFRELGFDTSFLDASPLFFESKFLHGYFGGEASYRDIDPEPIVIDDEDLLESTLGKFRDNAIVFHLSRFFKSVEDNFIFNELQKQRIPFLLQHFDALVQPNSFLQRSRIYFRMRRHRYYNRTIKPWGIVGSGTIGRRQSEFMFSGSRFISIPSVKVDWNLTPRNSGSSYVLFVDESIEYAPDAKLHAYEVSNDIEGYYERMNNLFSLIEDWCGVPVVIACSGKYKYLSDRFRGRKLIYGETFQLIQGASLVLGHQSLALEQCLVSEVPLLIIDDKSFTDKKRSFFPSSLTNLLKTPVLNEAVTTTILDFHKNSIDLLKVRDLRRRYLKESGVDAPFYEIVAMACEQSLGATEFG